MPRWADVLRVLRGVERWLLPAECLLCRRPVAEEGRDPLVCGLCRGRWQPLPDPVCATCGQPREGELECRLCADWPAGFAPVRSAVWLTGSARATVHYLKYRGWRRVSEDMAPAMRGLRMPGADVVLVPIPLGAARLRERGYNQSALLARSLAALLRVPVEEEALRRPRETARQTGLAPDARRANLSGAFTGRWRRRSVPVLVDDVFTTGATLIGAAEALLDGGAPEVGAVTFARARRPLDDDVTSLPADR